MYNEIYLLHCVSLIIFKSIYFWIHYYFIITYSNNLFFFLNLVFLLTKLILFEIFIVTGCWVTCTSCRDNFRKTSSKDVQLYIVKRVLGDSSANNRPVLIKPICQRKIKKKSIRNQITLHNKQLHNLNKIFISQIFSLQFPRITLSDLSLFFSSKCVTHSYWKEIYVAQF